MWPVCQGPFAQQGKKTTLASCWPLVIKYLPGDCTVHILAQQSPSHSVALRAAWHFNIEVLQASPKVKPNVLVFKCHTTFFFYQPLPETCPCFLMGPLRRHRAAENILFSWTVIVLLVAKLSADILTVFPACWEVNAIWMDTLSIKKVWQCCRYHRLTLTINELPHCFKGCWGAFSPLWLVAVGFAKGTNNISLRIPL